MVVDWVLTGGSPDEDLITAALEAGWLRIVIAVPAGVPCQSG